MRGNFESSEKVVGEEGERVIEGEGPGAARERETERSGKARERRAGLARVWREWRRARSTSRQAGVWRWTERRGRCAERAAPAGGGPTWLTWAPAPAVRAQPPSYTRYLPNLHTHIYHDTYEYITSHTILYNTHTTLTDILTTLDIHILTQIKMTYKITFARQIINCQ